MRNKEIKPGRPFASEFEHSRRFEHPLVLAQGSRGAAPSGVRQQSVIDYYPEVRLEGTAAGLLVRPSPTHVSKRPAEGHGDSLRPAQRLTVG
mgnify:CR=1 FL=1